MDLLQEIAIRAQSDGACTLEWPTLCTSGCGVGGLEDVPGENDVQKLRAWAERQSLFMDFHLENTGFTISTVTFWKRRQAGGHVVAPPTGAAEDHRGSQVDQVVGGS
jgi:hypothetical protein